jgi:hypothetical protein
VTISGSSTITDLICSGGYSVPLFALIQRKKFKFETEKSQSNAVETILDDVVKGYFWSQNKRASNMTQDYKKCIDSIIDAPGFIHYINSRYYSPVKVALNYQCDYAVYKLLEKGHYMTDDEFSLMEPEVFKNFLDSRITYEDTNKRIKVDYRFLLPPGLKEEYTGSNEDYDNKMGTKVLNKLVGNGSLKTLIKHPIMEIFLNTRKKQFMSYFIINLLLSFAFFVVPISLILLLDLGAFQLEKQTERNLKVSLASLALIFTMIREVILFFKRTFNWLKILLILMLFAFILLESQHEYQAKLVETKDSEKIINCVFSVILIITTLEVATLLSTVSVNFSVNILVCIIALIT